MDEKEQPIAEITDMLFFPTGGPQSNGVIKARILVKEEIEGLFFKDTLIKIGKGLTITTNRVSIGGTVSEIFEDNESTINRDLSYKYVTLLVGDIPVETLGSLEEGMTELGSKGEVAAEILEFDTSPIKSGKPTSVIIDTRLLVDTRDGTFLFRNSPLKVNEDVVLIFNNVNLKGKVLEISGEKNRSITNQKNLELTMFVVPLEVAKSIKIGDTMKSYSGKEKAKITGITTSPVQGPSKNMLLQVAVETRAIGNDLYFLDQPIKVGSPLNIIIDEVEIQGTISDINPPAKKVVEKTVTIKLQSVPPWFADNIFIGDKEMNSENRVMAEIIDKKVTPAEMVVITEGGEVYKRENPIDKDVLLTVKIWGEKVDNEMLFHNNEVKINGVLYLETGNMDLEGKIIEVS
ncbi:DUF4330 domain-containing protein [Candidatus Peregrinibacteria bacterium]|nr:DUF4330 domain-containing protein [Candidatus Peregrinibacteria bacterium]